MEEERLEQIIRDNNLLDNEQMEAARSEMRDAADRGENISLLEAAVKKGLLTQDQADEVNREADFEVSTSETQDISEALPSEQEPEPSGEEADQEPAQPAEENTGEEKTAAAEADQVETTEASIAGEEAPQEEQAQTEAAARAEKTKPPYTAIAIGLLILIALIILGAIFNR